MSLFGQLDNRKEHKFPYETVVPQKFEFCFVLFLKLILDHEHQRRVFSWKYILLGLLLICDTDLCFLLELPTMIRWSIEREQKEVREKQKKGERKR